MIINASGGNSKNIIKSSTEPSGVYPDGTIWYNTSTREFKTYIVDIGFVSGSSKMGLLRYQSVYTVPSDITTPQSITISIGISEFKEGDILEVIYEGLLLTATQHYTVNYTDKTITLQNFTVREGEVIAFIVTRVVDSSNITTIVSEFNDQTTLLSSHIATTGSSTREGHVKLSDTISTSDAASGIAATPKAVSDSRIITDSKTSTNYRFGIESGRLYLEEV